MTFHCKLITIAFCEIAICIYKKVHFWKNFGNINAKKLLYLPPYV